MLIVVYFRAKIALRVITDRELSAFCTIVVYSATEMCTFWFTFLLEVIQLTFYDYFDQFIEKITQSASKEAIQSAIFSLIFSAKNSCAFPLG